MKYKAGVCGSKLKRIGYNYMLQWAFESENAVLSSAADEARRRRRL